MTALVRRVLARLRTPWGCAALLLLITLDAVLFARAYPKANPRGPSGWTGLLREFQVPGNDLVATLYLVREPDGGRTVIDESQSVGMLADLSQSAPERVVSVSYWRGEWCRGVWAPWERRRVSRVLIWELSTGEAPTDARDAALARRAIADALRGRRLPEAADEVERGDFNTTSRVWWGIAHDGLVLVAVGMVVSCVPRLPGWVRAIGHRARLARQQCPKCRYDLRGVEAKGGMVRCPECGSMGDTRGLPT
ncbi:MAG: hypothetical protein HBSAPP03_13440 [Phycisphaerae bacterium]|nr:MAG: hypothetical protein HBSAPP03_13440 [Phycisphaerae bacterium]